MVAVHAAAIGCGVATDDIMADGWRGEPEAGHAAPGGGVAVGDGEAP